MQIDIERGDRAREVLQNPIYLEAFETIEKELVRAWKQSKSAEDRETLWLEQKLLSKVQTYLRTTMESGRLEREKKSPIRQTIDLIRSGTR